jgi:hypothetical protein
MKTNNRPLILLFLALLFAVSLAPAQWQREWQSGNLGTYAWGASYGYDVDNDGVPNLWSRDSGHLVIYHNYTAWWTITFSGYTYPMLITPRDADGDGLITPVNMDGDAAGEVVVTAYRISGQDILGRVRVYDASSHQLEWESSELSGFSGTASVDDVDGDGKHEIIITRTNYANNWGYVEVYGSSASGIDGKPDYALERSEPIALPAVSPGMTSIRFEQSAPAHARLAVFDGSGRMVRSLADADLPAGEYNVRWDGLTGAGSRVPAGSYVYRLERGPDVSTGSLVIVR